MKLSKHIPGCKCCSNTYAANWRHHFLQLSVNNWRNAELGFDVMCYTPKRRGQTGVVGRFRAELNLVWFTLTFERRFLNDFWANKSGNLDVYPFTDVSISAQVYLHQYPLNAAWDWGWVVSFPFIPTTAYHRCRLRTKAEEAIWEGEQS